MKRSPLLSLNVFLLLAAYYIIKPVREALILTGYADKENAIRAINEVGLFHYLEKPWDNDHLKLIIRNGIENKSLRETLYEKLHELDQVLLQRDMVIREHEVLRAELSLARQVQQSMLPQRLPTVDGLSFEVQYLPALEIGGDFYDVIPLADDQVGILIADMTGHGIQAALSTILLKIAFSPFASQSASPGEILSGMNAVLCKGLPQGLPSSLFAAAMVATIDTNTARCRIANGGLPHPMLLRRQARQVERIAANGMILGIVDEKTYIPGEELTVELKTGDALILYTDGLSETESETGEFFDMGLLTHTIAHHCEKPCADILEQLIAAAQTFSKRGHAWDDITILGVELNLTPDS